MTFAVATALVWGFELDDETAFAILRDYYNPRCQPAWSEQELRHKIESARENPPDKERGWLLRETWQCETIREGKGVKTQKPKKS